MKSKELGIALMMSTALTACATFKPPEIGYDDEQPAERAVLQGEPPRPVQVVERPPSCRAMSVTCSGAAWTW